MDLALIWLALKSDRLTVTKSMRLKPAVLSAELSLLRCLSFAWTTAFSNGDDADLPAGRMGATAVSSGCAPRLRPTLDSSDVIVSMAVGSGDGILALSTIDQSPLVSMAMPSRKKVPLPSAAIAAEGGGTLFLSMAEEGGGTDALRLDGVCNLDTSTAPP